MVQDLARKAPSTLSLEQTTSGEAARKHTAVVGITKRHLVLFICSGKRVFLRFLAGRGAGKGWSFGV